MIKDYLPYIVTAFSSILSAAVAIYVCNKNNKAAIKKLKEEQATDLDNKLRLMEEEQKKKIELLEQEYALKIGERVVSSFVDGATDAIYDSPAVKNAINKQASDSFRNSGKKKKRR